MRALKSFTIALFGFIFLLGCTKDDSTSSNENEIKHFVFEAEENGVLEKDYEGTILGTTITVRVPHGTDPNGLVPTIEVSDKASIYPKSGVPQNFTDAATYTVTAEDGSSQDYTVVVTELPSFRISSYYDAEGNRIGAGDFEKPDLFQISDLDMADGEYRYALNIEDKSVGSGELEITGGAFVIGGSELSIDGLNSIKDGDITIELVIFCDGCDNHYDTYNATKEQYSIRSWQDLQGMQYDLDGEYKLMNDISLPDPEPEGVFPESLPEEGFLPVGGGAGDGSLFKGSFDGGGNVISNFFIDRSDADNVGLFGYFVGTLASSIKNVGIVISEGGVTGGTYVGGLVGRLYTPGITITNCYVMGGDVTGVKNVSGLMGGTNGGTNGSNITNCYATVDVTGVRNNIGGLVGIASSGSTFTNCYATGDVTGVSSVGGLVGYSNAGGNKIINSYATGRVKGSSYLGGLVGQNYTEATASYWDITSTGRNGSAGDEGTGVFSKDDLVKRGDKYYGKNADEDEIEVFVDWNFGEDNDNPWHWVEDGEWPVLQFRAE